MEEKSNEATPQRAAGEHVLDASLVSIDITTFIEQLRNEKPWKESDRNAITVFKTNGMRIVLIALHKGIPHSVLAQEETIFLLTLTTTLEGGK